MAASRHSGLQYAQSGQQVVRTYHHRHAFDDNRILRILSNACCARSMATRQMNIATSIHHIRDMQPYRHPHIHSMHAPSPPTGMPSMHSATDQPYRPLPEYLPKTVAYLPRFACDASKKAAPIRRTNSIGVQYHNSGWQHICRQSRSSSVSVFNISIARSASTRVIPS